MATGTIKASDGVFHSGDTITGSYMMTGRTNNALNAIYGQIVLPRRIPSGVPISISDVSLQGYWLSSGEAPTFDYSGVIRESLGGSDTHNLWLYIPTTGLTKFSMCMMRITLTLTFS